MFPVATIIHSAAYRDVAATIISQLLTHPTVTVLPATDEWFDRGLSLYRSRPDKEWSLTDCISFQVMREREITQALTHDEHFIQAGFEAILRRTPS